MQQNYKRSDMASPYMLWEYVQLMAPMKDPDYSIHPAFTNTTPHIQSITYIQDQYVDNSNYHRNNEQFRHHHGHHPHTAHPLHFGTSLAFDAQNNQNGQYQPTQNENQLRKKHIKTNINCSQDKKSRTFQTTAAPSSLAISTSKKVSSFTIDAILSKKETCQSAVESSPSPVLVINQQRSTPNSNYNLNLPPASTPPKTTHVNSLFSFPPPLMHSTPTSHHSQTGPKKHSRLLDLVHPHPYFAQQYDSHDVQHLPHPFHHLPHMLPPVCMTSSSSSASSSGSLSAPSSTSTSPESTSTNEKTERRSGLKSKRIRTIFTPEQLERLETEFERQQYMVGNERFYLATSLNLTEAQVKVWFQNRRIKWRKQHLEQQQARLAQGDLYRDLDEESADSDQEEQKVTDSPASEPGFGSSMGQMSL